MGGPPRILSASSNNSLALTARSCQSYQPGLGHIERLASSPTAAFGTDNVSGFMNGMAGSLMRVVSLDSTEQRQQRQYGPQSKRGEAPQYQLNVLQFNEHADMCFKRFARLEEELCGEWAVFYHSYSYAALIYELHAAVGATLFQFRSQDSTLPRLLMYDFEQLSNATSLIDEFSARFANDRMDHHPDYRAVAISAMCSLVALGPEVSTPVMFLAGFSQKDLSFSGVLEKALASCYIPRLKIKQLAADIIKLSEKYGLDVSEYGGQPCESRKNGHLLQICIKRNLLDELAYASKPYGEVDHVRQPFSDWLSSDLPMNFGQARIVAHPKFFMSPSCVRMNVASADPNFHESRPRYQEELIALIEAAYASDPKSRSAAASGISGGREPEWRSSVHARSSEILTSASASLRSRSDCVLQ